MHPFIVLPLASCLIGAMMAGAIIARDPGERSNRLLAIILACSSYWSLCEVLWNTAANAETALWLVRLSGVGWLWLGPLALDLFDEIRARGRSKTRRWIPTAYMVSGAAFLLYLTPWCVDHAVNTSWGWGYRFGPLFPLAFAPTLVCSTVVLVRWPEIFPVLASSGEKRQARWLWFGIGVALVGASATDVILPYFGIHLPRFGSTSILMVGGVIALGFRRHGYFLLAPGAFAREILDTLRDGVALLRPDGTIRSCNASLARLVGQASEALHDAAVTDLLPGLSDDADGESGGVELELATDGELIPVAVSSSRVRDPRGTVVGRIVVVRDLRDVAALRRRLITSGRLAAVGEMAAGIAHEIKGPVSSLRSQLVRLRSEWATLVDEAERSDGKPILDPVFAEGEELIDESLEGVERVASIVRDVDAVAHVGAGDAERVDVNEVIDGVLNMVALRSPVVVEKCFGRIPDVAGASEQLRQVFLNLLLNSVDAVEDSGWVRVTTEHCREEVIVRIEDDGVGIPREELDRIFDPFFTTKPVGEATGLGLAICYQIVRSHGGEITVESQVHVGTTCEVRLPS